MTDLIYYVDEHWVNPTFDFDLSLWTKANLSYFPARRMGKTKLLKELEQMRALKQAITTDDVLHLNDITGRELWDAINQAGSGVSGRAEIFNRIINNRDTTKLTFEELDEDRERYLGRTVEYRTRRGVLSDVVYVGASLHASSADLYHLVIDGMIMGGTGSDKVTMFREEADEQVSQPTAEESARSVINRISDGYTYAGYLRAGYKPELYSEHTAEWILENFKELRGRTIQVRNSPSIHPGNGVHIRGPLECAVNSSKYSVHFLIGGQLCADEKEARVYLYEPEFCRTRRSNAADDKRCTKLRHHVGDHKFN